MSRFLSQLFSRLQRWQEEGRDPFMILLAGPPSGSTIESFSRHGARVTVDGEERPELPLSHEDGSFDLVLALDLIDFIDGEQAAAIGAEWHRVLRPGGKAFLVSRSSGAALDSGVRLEVSEQGQLIARPRRASTAQLVLRSNSELMGLLRPLSLDEVLLRRDGLREVIFKRVP